MIASSYNDLSAHIGHKLVCVGYGLVGNAPPANVAIECETCSEVLMDFDKPEKPAARLGAAYAVDSETDTEITVNGITYDKVADPDATGMVCKKCAAFGGEFGNPTAVCRSIKCQGFYLRAKNNDTAKQ